jgi:predicted TIM-barrel fold metal-dependent hydrolase
MILDCHVHVCANSPGHGKMSKRLLTSIPFRFMQWRFKLNGFSPQVDKQVEDLLARTLNETAELDAAVILAFDAPHTADGVLDDANTHLYATNDYVIELCRRHPKMRFGASIHPYRRDAVQELERCVKAGAVLLKWLPITQNFNPADPKCIPFYEALAHHKLTLLSHTGGEQSLPNLDKSTADPLLLKPALDRGVKVIMAHCGSRSSFFETDYTPNFIRMANEYEHCYGDTSALNLPTRWYAFDLCMRDKVAREKLVHGSDWPILPVPYPKRVGWAETFHLMSEMNWMRRDVLAKQRMEFDDAYWHRAANVLGIGATQATGNPQTSQNNTGTLLAH